MNSDGFLLNHWHFYFIIPFITKWHPGSVPQSFACTIKHDTHNTLGCELTFQLGKDKDYLEHRFTHGGAGVKLLIFGNKCHIVFFQFIIHCRKVEQVSRYSINLPDTEMCELSFADACHHLLESRAVGVLAGIAGIFKYFIAVCAKHIFGKVNQLLTLEGQAVLINLIEC